jgi:hypothetical protein
MICDGDGVNFVVFTSAACSWEYAPGDDAMPVALRGRLCTVEVTTAEYGLWLTGRAFL